MGIYAHHPRKANFLRRKMAATILKYLGACPNPITVVNNLFTFYEGNPLKSLKSINLHYPLFFQCFGMTQAYDTLYFSASFFSKGCSFTKTSSIACPWEGPETLAGERCKQYCQRSPRTDAGSLLGIERGHLAPRDQWWAWWYRELKWSICKGQRNGESKRPTVFIVKNNKRWWHLGPRVNNGASAIYTFVII